MRWKGKILCGLLGLFFMNLPGLFIGLLIGHAIDQGWLSAFLGKLGLSNVAQTREIFFRSTFMVMGFVAKSDGRVSEREIKAAQTVMLQMGLNKTQMQQAAKYFNLGKQPGFDIDAVIRELKQVCWRRPNLLRMFLEIQIQVGMAEGVLSSQKKRLLNNLCRQFGVMGLNFDAFERHFHAHQQYQQSRQRRSHTHSQVNSRQQLQQAYQLLEVNASASDAEVKKAYRKMMSQHHPDKLMAKGLPKEMIQMATAKTQQIKSAYEHVCKARTI